MTSGPIVVPVLAGESHCQVALPAVRSPTSTRYWTTVAPGSGVEAVQEMPSVDAQTYMGMGFRNGVVGLAWALAAKASVAAIAPAKGPRRRSMGSLLPWRWGSAAIVPAGP